MTVRTVSLQQAAEIVREVNQMVVSTEDVLPSPELPLHVVASQFPEIYTKQGPTLLELLEVKERYQTVRQACLDVAIRFAQQGKGKLGLAAAQIASAYFGVGECGVKSGLAGSKLLRADIPYIRLICNNAEFAKTSKLDVAQDHELNIVGIAKERLKQLFEQHEADVLKTLTACGKARIVDPTFGVACAARDIAKQTAFVRYMHFWQIDKCISLTPILENCVPLGNAALKEAQDIYEHVVKNKLIPKELSTLPERVLKFMREKKVEEMLAAMNRHFTPAEMVWKSDIAKRTILLEGDAAMQHLALEIQKYGIKCIALQDKQTKRYTLMISNTSIRELYHLEVRMATPSLGASIAEQITDYVASPFRGLRMDRTFEADGSLKS